MGVGYMSEDVWFEDGREILLNFGVLDGEDIKVFLVFM